MRKKVFKIFCFLLAFVAIERFCRAQTAGFREDKLRSSFVYTSSAYEPSSVDSRLFDQAFTFLGSGVQCSVFLGEDRETVLKVFKHYHNFPTKWLKSAPLPSLLEKWRQDLIKRREKRLQSIFSSCEMAFHEFKEETGLLYLHLQPTTELKKQVTLIDKIGIAHTLDLDTTAFILQKKVEMLREKFHKLLEGNEREEMKRCFSTLTSLIANRCKKGIANLDLRLERNIGFAGGDAIEIDVGSFKKAKPYKSRVLRRELLKLRRWVAIEYPEFSPHVEQEIQKHL